MTIAETMLGEFDQEMATTRTVLERVPDADPAWKPHPRSYSMGDLALHLADIPTWIVPTWCTPSTATSRPRIAVLRSFIMNHMIHHRAQLTVYLRLRDVPLPSVYGPTADLKAGQ